MLQTNASSQRWRSDPAAFALDLQPADVVLFQDRQHAVVGMFADAPTIRSMACAQQRRIVEDAEQDQRIVRVTIDEVVRVEAQTERDAAHQPMPELGHRVQVAEHSVAQVRLFGE